MKVFSSYLCELCASAIAKYQSEDEFSFVQCVKYMEAFPTDQRCTEFQLEEVEE